MKSNAAILEELRNFFNSIQGVKDQIVVAAHNFALVERLLKVDFSLDEVESEAVQELFKVKQVIESSAHMNFVGGYLSGAPVSVKLQKFLEFVHKSWAEKDDQIKKLSATIDKYIDVANPPAPRKRPGDDLTTEAR